MRIHHTIFLTVLALSVAVIAVGANSDECPKTCKCLPDPVQTTQTLLICDYDKSSSQSSLLPIATIYRHVDTVRSVHVNCAPGVVLPETLLKSMAAVQSLKIDGCRASYIPVKFFEDLTNLRALHLSRVSSQESPLEVLDDVLLPLTRLEKLAITESPSVVLPRRLLCTLANLQVLNVSSNSLTGLARDESCTAPQLIIADISGNNLKDVTNFLGGAPALRQLSLAHNLMEKVDLNGIAPLLQQLDLEGNRIEEMEGLQETLVHLNLASNRLQKVPDAVASLPNLVALNISMNLIGDGNQTCLASQQLESLDASANRLTSLPATWLEKCESSLVHLKLDKNQIEEIPPQSFANATHLQSLDLSSNNIRLIADESLTGASKLNVLRIANNSLETVETMALAELELESLDLSSNRLAEIPAALGRLAKLRKLDLSRNNISKLYQFMLNKLSSLHSIDLSKNRLASIGPFIFSDSAELYSIDLSQNNITIIFKDAFMKCPKLRKLILANNSLKSLDDGLLQATSVRRLDLSYNQLSLLLWTNIPAGVEHLMVDHNAIDLIGAAASSKAKNVKTLSLVGNRISLLNGDQLPASLEVLDVSENSLRHVSKGTFATKSSLRRVSFEKNQLTTLEVEALRVIEAVHPLRLTLAGNPLDCSCDLNWATATTVSENDVTTTTEKKIRVIIDDEDSVTCRHAVDGSTRLLGHVAAADLLCPYQQVCEPGCVCCQYGNCDCKSICPAGCRCFRDASFNINVVRCVAGEGNATEIKPNREFVVSEVPVYATDVILSGLALPQLRTHSFIGRLRLQKLHINATGLKHIQPKAFHTLPSLKTLDLSDNSLSSMTGEEFIKTNELANLFLNGNRFTTVHRGLFEKLPGLRFLTLHNNSLEDVPPVLSHISTLRSVSLSGNPFRCDCAPSTHEHQIRSGMPVTSTARSAYNAPEWMQSNRGLVVDAARVHCWENVTRAFRDNDTTILSAYPPNVGHDVFVMSMDAFLRDYNVSICVPYSSGFFGQDRQSSVLFFVFAVACSFLLCALVILAVSLAKKTHAAMNQRRYKATSSLNCSTSAGSSPLPLPLISYHAFVSYSKRDEKMVLDELCRPLEDEDYQLCLLHRDGPVYNLSVHAISDELSAQMDASQCLIIVITKSFLENEWKTLQVKASHQLYAKNRSKRLIAIMDEGIGNLIDDELGQVLRKNTCINIRDHLFWTLLHSALPSRIPLLQHTSNTSDDGSQVYSDVYGIVPSHII